MGRAVSTRKRRHGKAAPAIAALAIASVAALCFFLLSRANEASAPRREAGTHASMEAKSGTAAKGSPGAAIAAPDRKTVFGAAAPAGDAPYNVPKEHNAPRTDEKTAKADTPGVKAKNLFDNDVENLLAAVSEPDGEFAMPFPQCDLSVEEILSYLKRPVLVYGDDDEKTVAVKELTTVAKTEALEYISLGGTFNQYLRDRIAVLNEEAAQVEEIRLEMVRIFRKDGLEAASAFLDAANPKLRAMGLKEVSLPMTLALSEHP